MENLVMTSEQIHENVENAVSKALNASHCSAIT